MKPIAMKTRSASIISVRPVFHISGRPPFFAGNHSTSSTSTPFSVFFSPMKRTEARFQRRMHPSSWLLLVFSTCGYRGQGVVGLCPTGGWGMISICVTLAALAVPTQSLPVSPPPMTRIFLPLQLMMSLGGMTMPSRIRFCCDNSSRAKWTPFRLRPSMGRSRGTSEPMAIQTASNVEAISLADTSLPTIVLTLKTIPSCSISRIRRSMMFFPNLKFGIPNRSRPPGSSYFSNTVTSYPRRFSWLAAVSPAGPLPITATRLPLRMGRTGWMYPSRKAASTMEASFSRIVTGSSQLSFSTQLFSQRAGQMRPVNSGKSQVCSNTWKASRHLPL